LKLFFVNENETNNKDKICFQKELDTLITCIDYLIDPLNSIKTFTLSRDTNDFISLNGQPTNLKLTGDYG
jgi:hypothetical protein